jgi:hypothetical protein
VEQEQVAPCDDICNRQLPHPQFAPWATLQLAQLQAAVCMLRQLPHWQETEWLMAEKGDAVDLAKVEAALETNAAPLAAKAELSWVLQAKQ